MRWCSGSAYIVDDGLILGEFFYFSSHGMYELIQQMNSYTRWIQYEFKKFCTLNIWIHTNMNLYFIWIHIFFAVILYEFIYFLQCKIKAASARELRARSASCKRAARAASAQRKPRGQSPSSPPAPTRPRTAASTVRVACGSPDS
jgi:hypothetical protein